MKYVLSIISFAILFASCGIIKKDTNKQENKQEQTTDTKTEKPLTDKQKQKQREKEIQANRKKQLEENKRRDKEFAKKKKQEEKEKRRKEKEQDDIIKNAAKTERQRVREERKKEKATLLSSQKLAEQEADAQTRKQQELEAQEKQRLADEQEKEKLLVKQEKEVTKQNKKEEQELLKQEKERAEQEKKAKQEERKKKFESLSTMDQIVYRMQHPEEEIEQEHSEMPNKNSDSTITTLTDSEKKKIIASKGEEEGNFFKRTYRKIFPQKEARSTIYSKIYKEKPLTIMVAYPWNRSEYKAASEMAYTACVKELSEKGYYLLPALSFMDELKKDTTKNTKYLTPEQIKSFKEKYNVDAVLLLTIYRVEKPWWSTNINVVTHYDLISTQSLDTLFVRHADFNYDSPMPVKEKNNKKLLNDPEQLLYLGLFERMQKYVFLDLPAGPYHKDYQQDKKRKAEKQEVKYKVTIKPS